VIDADRIDEAYERLLSGDVRFRLVIDLSRFAATIDVARLDAAFIKAVKTNILDTLSCAPAGSSAKAIAEVSGPRLISASASSSRFPTFPSSCT
jgi:hypothetical protein